MSDETNPADTPTLYERLGGQSGIAKLIDRFYDKVASDPELGPFFEHTPMERLRAMQREFFAAALEGPQCYSGLSLARAHEGRGITNRHFSRYVGLLLDTLKEAGVPPHDVDAVVDRISTYVEEITGDTPSSG